MTQDVSRFFNSSLHSYLFLPRRGKNISITVLILWSNRCLLKKLAVSLRHRPMWHDIAHKNWEQHTVVINNFSQYIGEIGRFSEIIVPMIPDSKIYRRWIRTATRVKRGKYEMRYGGDRYERNRDIWLRANGIRIISVIIARVIVFA